MQIYRHNPKIERSESPAGNPQEGRGAGTSRDDSCPAGLSERSISPAKREAKCLRADCPHKPNPRTGLCRLHDAMAMVYEAEELITKAISELAELDRADSADREETES